VRVAASPPRALGAIPWRVGLAAASSATAIVAEVVKLLIHAVDAECALIGQMRASVDAGEQIDIAVLTPFGPSSKAPGPTPFVNPKCKPRVLASLCARVEAVKAGAIGLARILVAVNKRVARDRDGQQCCTR
jgi:hypothetical protein